MNGRMLRIVSSCVTAAGIVLMTGCGSANQGGANEAGRKPPAPTTSVSPSPTSVGETSVTHLSLASATPARPRASRPSPVVSPTQEATEESIPAGWQVYVNRQNGYKLAYPGDWSVSERTNESGYQVATLEPAKSGNAISIKAVPSNRAIAEKPRQPNAICHPVAVNGVHGQQCTVTTSFTTTTSLASGETTYLITTEGKGARNEVYDRVVSSFRIQDEARK